MSNDFSTTPGETDDTVTMTTPLPTVSTATPEPSRPARLRVRIGTIVWGAILVALGAVGFYGSTAGFTPWSPASIVWTIVGFGALLVLVAIIAGVASAIRGRSTDAASDDVF